MEKKLSIIIPVYNVEKYIRECLESVLRQDLPDDDYETIIVNDGTPDNSMEQIADLVTIHSNITVINQENKGLSVARNNGMARAMGEYILFLDADDYLIENNLPILLEKALSSHVDIGVADYIDLYIDESSSFHSPSPQHIEWKEKTGRELFVEPWRLYHGVVWRILFRREFLLQQHLSFIPGICAQDFPFTHESYLKASKCITTNLPIVAYRNIREGSATSSFKIKYARDFCIAIGKTWSLKDSHRLSKEEYKSLQRSLFERFYLLMTKSIKSFSLSDRLHVIDTLSKYAPDLTFSEDIYQKMITLFYRISPRFLMLVWSIKSILQRSNNANKP